MSNHPNDRHCIQLPCSSSVDTLLGDHPIVTRKNALQRHLKKNTRIRKEASQAGVSSPGHGRPATIDRERVLKWWQTPHNYTQTAIAEKLGCTQAAVRYILLQIGDGELPPREVQE